MAQSRLEKIGTIYTRVIALMKGGVMKDEDAPIWFAVYKAFPPKYEPKFDRPGSKIPVPDIYYSEDLIRAKLHKEFSHTINNNLNSYDPSITQKFIAQYRKFEKEGVPENELYDKTREEFHNRLKIIGEVRVMKEENEVREMKKEKEEIKSRKTESSINLKELFENDQIKE